MPKRKDTHIPQSSGPTDNVADEAVNEEMDGSLERAATTATSLDVEQDMGNINKTQSKATPNEAGSQGTTSGGDPKCQETMGDTIDQTRFENVSKTSNDPRLARGNTLQSGEDSLKLNELMELCTNLQQRVLDLETTKTTQANEIASLKKRVKKLESRNKSRTYGLKRMYRVGSSRRVESTKVIVDNVDVVKPAEETRSVVEEVTAFIEKVKLVSAAEEIVNVVATTVSTASTIPISAATTTTTTITTTIITDVEITLDQALAELKSEKPKTVKAKIKANYQLAQRLQAQEQEELTDEEKARLFVQFLEQRRKHCAAKRAEEKRNRPPTRARQRSIINEKGDKLEQENTNKHKVDEDKETAKLQSLIEVVLDDEEEVAIDVIPLATKPPTIVDWKIHKEGKKSYYQIIRADGKT
ncbi:hypothetical protein Tco_1385048 [Tanacetum coccineum]